jgi:hypothetical protein
MNATNRSIQLCRGQRAISRLRGVNPLGDHIYKIRTFSATEGKEIVSDGERVRRKSPWRYKQKKPPQKVFIEKEGCQSDERHPSFDLFDILGVLLFLPFF